jgi:hypothetical protein
MDDALYLTSALGRDIDNDDLKVPVLKQAAMVSPYI